MATRLLEHDIHIHEATVLPPNGAALAAFAGAGVGSFLVGLIVLLNELGIYSPPTLYEPAGGVTGRTTLAIALWLVAWAVLHVRWRHRELEAGRVFGISLLLIVLGMLGTFPPLWGLL
ncbi:MAG TPA: hypothetical protein VFZ18_13985 [Longimicrobiaceae bacterium]